MKRLLPSLLLALALVVSAGAKEFKLPEKSPKVSIQVPDDWETGDTDAGFDAQNKDHTVYLALESAGSAEDYAELVEEAHKHWKDTGKKVDKSKGQKSTAQILGMEAKVVTWNTTDAQGPLTLTMTSFQIDGVWFLLSQSIAKETDRASADKLKKAVASLALAGGGKSLGAAVAGTKEAAPAKPAATPAPAKPAATEAPAVASAKASAPAEPPPAAKPAAGTETVMYPKESPILSFMKPAGWVISTSASPRTVMTVAQPDGSAVTFSGKGVSASDAEMKDLLTESAKRVAENGPTKGFKPGALQEAAIGPFKGFLVEVTGEVQGQPLIVKIHMLRDPKGRSFSVVVPTRPGPPPAETRALLDSIVSLP